MALHEREHKERTIVSIFVAKGQSQGNIFTAVGLGKYCSLDLEPFAWNFDSFRIDAAVISFLKYV